MLCTRLARYEQLVRVCYRLYVYTFKVTTTKYVGTRVEHDIPQRAHM